MRFTTDHAPIEAAIDTLIVAGWTGRDQAAVTHHIKELAEIGVKPPSQVPLFYRSSRSLLTQAPEIEVLGDHTSGEVEPLIVKQDGALWLGLGSDHTDRQLESVSVAASKQACPKPVAAGLWALDEVAGRLDDLILRCEIAENGAWVLYQEGVLAAMRPLPDLAAQAGLANGGAMLCGTLGAIGPIRPASAYRMALIDTQRDRSLTLSYRVKPLTVVE